MAVVRKFIKKTGSETNKTYDIGAKAINVSYNNSNVQDAIDNLNTTLSGITEDGSIPAINANYSHTSGSAQTAQSASSAKKLENNITVILGGDDGNIPDSEVYAFEKGLNTGQTIRWNSRELSQTHSHYAIATVGGWGFGGGSSEDKWIYDDATFGQHTFGAGDENGLNAIDEQGTIDNAWKKTYGKLLIRMDLNINDTNPTFSAKESVYAWAPLDLIFDNIINEPVVDLRLSYFRSPQCYMSTKAHIEKIANPENPSDTDRITVTVYYNKPNCLKTDNVELRDVYLYMVQ